MKKLACISILLSLAGCGNSCFSDACWAQKRQAQADADRAYLQNLPPPHYFTVFAKTELACGTHFGLSNGWLQRLADLKNEEDMAAYNRLKNEYIRLGRCRMFKKGTTIISKSSRFNGELWSGRVEFRIKGSPSYYQTFQYALE